MEIWAILPEWVFSAQASAWQILSFDDWPQIYQNCSRLCHKILLSFFMNEFLLSTIFWINHHYIFSINLYYLFSGSHKFYFVTDMKSSIITKCDHLNFLSHKRKHIYDFLLSTKSFAKLVTWMIRLSHISLQKTMEKMAQILFTLKSNCDFNVKHLNISFSENNWSLIWTKSHETSAFKITVQKFYGFQETDMVDKYFILSIWEVYHHSMWSSQLFFQKRKQIYDFLFSTTSSAKISYLDDSVVTYQSAEERPWEKVAQILITLTSCCDFHLKCSNISFSAK